MVSTMQLCQFQRARWLFHRVERTIEFSLLSFLNPVRKFLDQRIVILNHLLTHPDDQGAAFRHPAVGDKHQVAIYFVGYSNFLPTESLAF